jgi:hypothetical protein
MAKKRQLITITIMRIQILNINTKQWIISYL